MTLPELVNKCLVCGVVRPASVGDWRRVSMHNGSNSAGPLCGLTCEEAFIRWPIDQKYRAIFGAEGRGVYLMEQLRQGKLRRDYPVDGHIFHVGYANAVEEECPHTACAQRAWSAGQYVCQDSRFFTLCLTAEPWTAETALVWS